MKLEDVGIARDERDGTNLRASTTVGTGIVLDADAHAARNCLISLVRQADEAGLILDVTSIKTERKRMQAHGSDATRILVVCSATAYP